MFAHTVKHKRTGMYILVPSDRQMYDLTAPVRTTSTEK